MKLSKYFISVDEYLTKVKDYINEETYKYLCSLKDSHKVLVNGKDLWFDDSNYFDEIFRPTLFLPKYQLDNLRVIIENKLVDVALRGSNRSYGCDTCHSIKPIGLISSSDKLLEYDTLIVDYHCTGSVGLIGRDSHIIGKDICDNYSYSVSLVNTTSPQNTILDEDSAVGNATKFILDNWFTKEELILLDKATSKTLNLLYKVKVMDKFIDLAFNNVYSKALFEGSMNSLNINNITFEGDRTFKYVYNGVDFTFSVCYNKTTDRLFIKTFTCDEEVNPRLKNYVENKLMSILENVPIVIKESAKVLNTVINEVQNYLNDVYEELVKSSALGKDDYLSIIREYPLNLMEGNVNTVVNKILLDFYGNK